MGFGDVKLGLLLGLVVGARSLDLVLVALLLAGLLGAVGGLALMVRHRRRDVTLAFGPYLVAGRGAGPGPRRGLTPGTLRTVPVPCPGAPLPDRRRVARSGPRRHRRGAAGRAAVTAEEVQGELARRRLGFGRGPRMRFEADEITLLGGIRHGRTLGSPVAIEIKNSEWSKSDRWHQEMSAAPGRTEQPLTQPRPGHADLAGMQKYGFGDARDVLERASARETAARVAAGCLAKALLAELGVGGAEPRHPDGRRPGRRARSGPARPTWRPSTSRPSAASTTPRPTR